MSMFHFSVSLNPCCTNTTPLACRHQPFTLHRSSVANRPCRPWIEIAAAVECFHLDHTWWLMIRLTDIDQQCCSYLTALRMGCSEFWKSRSVAKAEIMCSLHFCIGSRKGTYPFQVVGQVKNSWLMMLWNWSVRSTSTCLNSQNA